MIEFKEALRLTLENVSSLPAQRGTLSDASGHYLAETILAPHDHPFFDQSAMDGYAVRYQDLDRGLTFRVAEEIPAGHQPTHTLAEGECARIFTGAAVPSGADTIIMQEQCEVTTEGVSIDCAGHPKGSHIRYRGEQITKGDVALEAGTLLSPAAIGFLGSIGVSEVAFNLRPTVGIVATGSEFAESSDDLARGRIFESNREMLAAAARSQGFEVELAHAPDDEAALEATFKRMTDEHRFVITTGGVSVGKYDLTKPTLEKLGFETVFHKVNQKPGKPLLVMRKGDQMVFGLPGNPRAALIGFYVYVLSALRASQGANSASLKSLKVPLGNAIQKNDGKTHFRSVYLREGKAWMKGGQQSHMLGSLAEADGLLIFDAATSKLEAGAEVDVLLLP